MPTSKYQEIYRLIKQGKLKQAQDILDQIKLTEHNEETLKMLYNYILDQEYISHLSDEQKEEYYKIIKTGHDLYTNSEDEESLYEALDVYRVGEYLYNTPIFKYYIGKIYYKLHDYYTAESYLLEYLKNGSDKTSKAYLYLYKISQKLKRNNDILYLSKMDRVMGDINPTFKLKIHDINKLKGCL